MEQFSGNTRIFWAFRRKTGIEIGTIGGTIGNITSHHPDWIGLKDDYYVTHPPIKIFSNADIL